MRQDLESQKTTSKTSQLNSMLLKAWRDRWTDCQWGTNIKTILPRYNLADCILQQALVGSGANQLLLSYLRHSLCSHLISHAAVLKRIAKYECYHKHYCIVGLLEFIDSIIDGISCRGKPEEAMLTGALLLLVHWLLQVYQTAIEPMHGSQSEGTCVEQMQELSLKILNRLMNNQFLLGVLVLAKNEDTELFTKITNRCSEITALVNLRENIPQAALLKGCLQRVSSLDIDQLHMVQIEPKSVETITYCMQPLLAVEVLLNPSSDTQIYVAELLMIQRLKKYSNARLYYELIRACFISLNNVIGSPRESMWCAFTFIRVPHILKQLTSLSKEYDDKLDYSPSVVKAFEYLLDDVPILDFMDTKCACNTLEWLLNEMAKQHVVNDKQVKHFASKRESITANLQKLEINNQQPSIIKFVIRAEPPLAGILKTLSTDYNKVQEALLSMLCQVLSGNSFDLILSVATVEGKLKTFVSRLIKCNECSKQVPGEVGKAAATRLALFDVSFLMLASIVQSFGSDVVLDENGDSFFEKWVRECMVEQNKSKSSMNMVQLCDQSKVDELLVLLNSPDGLASSSLKWHEVCMNIPGMLYHVLLAWENETLSTTDVKITLDSMKVRLCSYSVCAASWLCAYMQIVRQDELLKPMNMVQQFLTALSPDEMSQQDNFKERLGLTFQIIRKMQHDFHPSGNPKIRALKYTQNIVSQSPLEEQFTEIWKSVADRGWLPIEATQVLDSLLQTCGPLWLVSKLVNEILQCKYMKDMNRIMDIVFAIMHLDIERCTIALLSEVIPMLLLNRLQNPDIIEPHSTVLARLCVYAILSTMDTPNGNTKKRSRTVDPEEIDNLCPTPKIRKLNPDHSGDSSSSDFIVDSLINLDPPSTIREPLQSCLLHLFKTFGQTLVSDDFSPKVYFIFQLLSILVQCGNERIKPILKLFPTGLIQNLLKIILTDEITVGLILRLNDLSTQAGRSAAMSDISLYRNIHLRKDSIKI